MTVRAEDLPRTITGTYSTDGMRFKFTAQYFYKAQTWQMTVTDPFGDRQSKFGKFPFMQIDAMLLDAIAKFRERMMRETEVAS